MGVFYYGDAEAVSLENTIGFDKHGQKIITGDSDDPTIIAKSGAQGSIYLRLGGGVYFKNDNGLTRNWSIIPSTSSIDTASLINHEISSSPEVFPTPMAYAGTIRQVNDEASIVAAIAASSTGDVVELTADITLTSTLTINKSIKITGNFSLMSAGTAGDPVSLINVTANDVYISSGISIKHKKTTNTSVDAAVTLSNATGFVSEASVEFLEFAYVLRGSFSISGSTNYNTGTNTNSHTHFLIYKVSGPSQINGVTFSSIAPPTPTGTQYDNFIKVTTSAGGDVFDYTLKVANCHQSVISQTIRQFLFFEVMTKNLGATPALWIENNKFNDLNGGIGLLGASGESPLDFFSYIYLLNNWQGDISVTANAYKGMLFIDGAGALHSAGSCPIYYSGNRHPTTLRSANDYTSALDYAGIAYKNTVYNALTISPEENVKVDNAIYNYVKELVTETSLAKQLSSITGTISAWVTSHAYVAGNIVTESNVLYLCLISHTSGVFATDFAAGKWISIGITASYRQGVPTGTVNGVNPTFLLPSNPVSKNSLVMKHDGISYYPSEYTLSGNQVDFNVGSIPVTGQELTYYYPENSAPVQPSSGNLQTGPYTHTLTGVEITAKEITLTVTPTDGTRVVLDIIGGTSQEYGVDYIVVGDKLTWNGFALDGQLIAGQKLRIMIFN